MSLFFRPARALRRAQSGQSCPGCGLTVHANDLVMYPAPTRTYVLHGACAHLLVEQMAAAASGAEEDAPETAATAERTALDAGDSSVPEQHHWADWSEEWGSLHNEED